ncbi:MAG: VOC family protein [Cytophagaceae bacterium]|nr:VOC family protein [Cytophagaceae bacterium]
MTFHSIVFATLISVIGLVSCSPANKTNPEVLAKDTTTDLKENTMKSYISMFEIPARDISRAIQFYQAVLDIKIEKMEVDGMKMGILPYEGQLVTGVIMQAEGYTPSADGVTMYLNAGDNLKVMLDKVVKNGGQIVVPKTAHADGNGYFALFLDSEGNKMALNSPH